MVRAGPGIPDNEFCLPANLPDQKVPIGNRIKTGRNHSSKVDPDQMRAIDLPSHASKSPLSKTRTPADAMLEGPSKPSNDGHAHQLDAARHESDGPAYIQRHAYSHEQESDGPERHSLGDLESRTGTTKGMKKNSAQNPKQAPVSFITTPVKTESPRLPCPGRERFLYLGITIWRACMQGKNH